MKHAADISQAQKIYNCIDELLMEDVEYQVEQDRVGQEMENSTGFKKVGSRMGTSLTMRSKAKMMISPDRRSAATTKRMMKNVSQTNKEEKKTKFLSPPPTHQIKILDEKGAHILSDPNLDSSSQNLKLKQTISQDPNRLPQIKQTELSLIEPQSDNSFINTREVSAGSINSPSKEMKVRVIKKDDIKLTTKDLGKGLPRSSETNGQKLQKFLNTKRNSSPSKTQFNLTHDELQFLSLLYPNETPQQLMLKLLNYYEQQAQYKNSFQDIACREQKRKKNYFFKSSANLYDRGEKDGVKQDQEWEEESTEEWMTVREKKGGKKDEDDGEMLNQYTRLKEECMAALGSQIVETHVKSSVVETANVNYYTRQYAMPHIMELVEQKNRESQQKLEKHNLSIVKFPQQKLQPSPNKAPTNLFNQTTFNYNQQLIHKFYIPANSRGQCFDMDYEPDPTLFNYLPENQYRRILRDINHLIQKVLLYHRHNSFLKKRSNSLLGGWNLVLVVFLFSLLALLYIECFFRFEKSSSYLEIVVFFSLSFVLILIMGNAFNNYKKSVKRSSLIKDICEEITNYLQFANCSNKNIKWVLGKDFFWLEIWIYLRRGLTTGKENGK